MSNFQYIYRNPNTPIPVAVEWPSFTLDKQQYIDLNRDMSNNSIKQFLAGRRADFWLKTVPAVLDAIEHAQDSASMTTDTDTCTSDGDGLQKLPYFNMFILNCAYCLYIQFYF